MISSTIDADLEEVKLILSRNPEQFPYLDIPALRWQQGRLSALLDIPSGTLPQIIRHIVRNTVSLGTMASLPQCEKQATYYCLADRYALRKVHRSTQDGLLQATACGLLISPQKAWACIDLNDQNGKPAYRSELVFSVIEDKIFQGLFHNLKSENLHAPHEDYLPEQKMLSSNHNSWISHIEAFTPGMCAGHFPGYACVPTSFVSECVMQSARDWMAMYTPECANPELQSFDIILDKAIPASQTLQINAHAITRYGKSRHFICNVTDDAGNLFCTCQIALSHGV